MNPLNLIARDKNVSAEFRQIISGSRDPRLTPKQGDVLRKWNQTFLVTRVNMGCVYTVPSLSERGWVGIQFFRSWAATTELASQEVSE